MDRDRPRRRPSNYDLGMLCIPSNLRVVAPFLEEAQSRLRDDVKATNKIVVYCLDHAFELVVKFRVRLDEDSRVIMNMFRVKRDEVAERNGMPRLTDDEFNALMAESCSSAPLSPRHVSADDVLIGEAMSTLALADEEYNEGDFEGAARNYHTATVYFRVLESMVPRLAPKVRLISAVGRVLTLVWCGESSFLTSFSPSFVLGARVVDVRGGTDAAVVAPH